MAKSPSSASAGETAPTPPRKKQKTADGAAVAFASCSSDSKDAPSLTLPEALPLLTAEIIARVASFASYGTDAMNICLAVGPKDSAIIRHTCLRNNMQYLTHRLGQNDNPSGVTDKQLNAYALAWMAVNTDWRKLCTPANRQRFALVEIEEDDYDYGAIAHTCNALALFNNPMVAIEYGLVDVLKHLVEEIGIDVNAYKWNTLTTIVRMHLLVVSFFTENLSCFQYLIKREDIDVNSGSYEDRDENIFEVAFTEESVKASTFQAVVCHSSFNPNSQMEEVFAGGLLYRPLQYAIQYVMVDPVDDEEQNLPNADLKVSKIQIMLSKTDADPSLSTADFSSPISLACRALATSENEPEARERLHRIVTAIKQSHPDSVGHFRALGH